ncbi:cytochrome aa3 quinol oxidase subunit IV [Shouchella clausii]|uniref:cytochrome aa3 quinol oxidase subunit IV n=1 Tax=Shouchella clausii TaxID=79880 RepID=UPI000BA7257D|nr:cytochrome aa3 quinol oxidase subunit IV [Shouchella clausii]SPU22458.1 cytochrome aa3 quinol oxidase subunit IV QoxD [Niallia circulans]MCM3549350.1 cytochrome aa3 quinol oxidase subunit IV [Shouchella clausii]MEB5482423.1 cytochrome aa3 quinol oxidase subunit IV [Shouchella clausii]PAD17649.1 cytochrome aa3 quinol oxidase subunit IV [Shouchella clausii]PAD93722.1 cytochrome aa3 quinol oxidase subunit IV [Shouchella clausii]
MAQEKEAAANHHGFPWKHVIGFVLSIVLTLLAVWVMSQTNLAWDVRIIIVFVFAFIQMTVQLHMFMHIGEGKAGYVQIGHTWFAIIIAVIIVIGSYLVLRTGHI